LTTALLLPVILDLKAKAPVQHFSGCNAYFGCSFCLQKGIHSNYKHLFPYEEFVELRNKGNVESCIQQVYLNVDYSPVSFH
jgi:hypothetical protein